MVLLIAWAAALWTVGSWLLVDDLGGLDAGWTSYPPADAFGDDIGVVSGRRFSRPLTTVITLAFIAAWAGAGLWPFRRDRSGGD